MIKYIIAAVLALLINLSAFAQNKAILSGTVTDKKTGEGLVGAAVVLFTDSSSTKPLAHALTNKTGYFKLDADTGNYFLRCTFIGYEDYHTLMNISGDVKLQIKLSSKNIELQQVVIEARRDTIRNVGVIELSPALLKMMPSMSGEVDLFRALTLLPGVTTSSEISNGIYIRGGSQDQNLVLVDGISLYNPFHLGGFASVFSSDALQDIKLIKSGFPARYGGRLSGVLDLALKEGSSQKMGGLASLGSNSGRVLLEGPIGERSTFLISGRKLFLDQVQKSLMSSNKVTPLYNFYDLNGKFVYKLNEEEKIVLSGYLGHDYLYSPKLAEDASYNINWGNSMVNLGWLHLSKEQKFTKVLLGFSSYNFNTLIQPAGIDAFKQDFFSTSSIKDYSLKIEGQYFSNASHTVRNGIESTLHNFDLINNNYYSEEVNKDERFRTEVQSIELAGFIEDQWVITERLSSNMGLRLTYFPKSRYFSAEPRVTVNYTIFENFTLKGGYSWVNQAVHLITRNDVMLPTDIWFPVMNEIEPAKSEQISAEMTYELPDKEYSFSLEGYTKKLYSIYEYKDDAVFSFEVPFNQQLTKGKGESYGIEMFVRKQSGDITGWLGYTLSWTRRKFDHVNSGQTFYPRYDHRHDLSLVLTYKLNDYFDFGMTWIYISGQPYTMPTGQYYFPPANNSGGSNNYLFLDYTGINSYRLPDYHKLDISGSYNFIWNNFSMKLTLSIYNVYNRQNPLGRYVSYENNGQGLTSAKMKQFTLFPFFPSLNIIMNF